MLIGLIIGLIIGGVIGFNLCALANIFVEIERNGEIHETN